MRNRWRCYGFRRSFDFFLTGNIHQLIRRLRQVGFIQQDFFGGVTDRETQRFDAGIGIVQHRFRKTAPLLDCFQVELDTDNGIGQPIKIFRRGYFAAAENPLLDIMSNAFQQQRRSLDFQQAQARLDLVNQRRDRSQHIGFHRILDEIRDRILDARQVDDRFANDRAADLAEIRFFDAQAGSIRIARCRIAH